MKPKIPQFITNTSKNTSPFKFNANFDINEAGEANTYNQIYAEWCHLVGNDCIFIPREVRKAEPIFGEYLANRLNDGYPLRLFNDELAGGQNWNGSGDMYSKFGLQITDETTFYCPTLVFQQLKVNEDPVTQDEQPFIHIKPKVGDLIYYLNGKKLFEIKHIENEAAPGMYIFGNRNSYQMKCKAYTYDHSEISETSNLPEELKALSSIQTINEKEVNIQKREEDNHNNQISSASEDVIDNTEVDPIG